MVIQKLQELGIHVKDREGEQRVLCPECSHLRRKKNDQCLAVRIDGDGARFHCWHCDFKGGVSKDFGGGRRMDAGKKRDKPGDFGQSRRRLQYGVLS